MSNQQSPLFDDREAWLTEAAAVISDDIIAPALPQGHAIPHPYRVSVGFPPRRRAGNKRTLAVCCVAEASADLHNEIFVTPELADPQQILAALVHELIHQADNCESGHRNFFAQVARRVGLDGKLTATTAGPELAPRLDELAALLGPIPHASLNIDQAAPKQSTRMIKVECKRCGFHFRSSTKQLDRVDWPRATCPCCREWLGTLERADTL